MREQFLDAVGKFNAAVFSNTKRNKAFCSDVFDLDPRGYDCVYIDTPYISPYSDCDYTRRYHFVEGFCTYWQHAPINPNTSNPAIIHLESTIWMCLASIMIVVPQSNTA